MKAEKTFFQRLQEGYRIAKKPIAYIIIFAAAILETPLSDFIPQEQKRITLFLMMIVLALILLEMLFDIYEKITKEEKALNLIASGNVHNRIESILQKEKVVSVKYIGIAGRNGWTNVLSKLLDDNNPDSLVSNRTKFDIKVGLLNPNTQKENPEIYERFNVVGEISNSIKSASDYIKDVSVSGSKISLFHYNHMPNMLGFLINDNYLYVTYAYWENLHGKLTLRGGGTDYFEYSKNDDFGGQEVIRRFNGWFNYIESSSECYVLKVNNNLSTADKSNFSDDD